VAYPPPGHPQAGRRGQSWPRVMAMDIADRTGLGLSTTSSSTNTSNNKKNVVHAYVDVKDQGENLVGILGLQTVPTHVLVDSDGKVVSVLARKQFPNGRTVESLIEADTVTEGRTTFCRTVPCS